MFFLVPANDPIALLDQWHESISFYTSLQLKKSKRFPSTKVPYKMKESRFAKAMTSKGQMAIKV